MTQGFDTNLDKLLAPAPPRDDPRWPAYMQTFSTYAYHTYHIPKSGGGTRIVEEPLGPVKKKQKELLKELQKFQTHPDAYAVQGKGYLENGLAHRDAKELLRVDIKNFYPNCSFERLMSCIQDEELKAFLQEHVQWCFIQNGTLHLATGSPLSPLVATLALKPIDEMLSEKIADAGGVYTRYLDDITISFSKTKDDEWKTKLKEEVLQVLEEQNWPIHHGKTDWVNPLKDAVTVTGVDVRAEPKVTARYIRTKMRPALDKEAQRLLGKFLDVKPYYWNYTGIETREDFLVNLSPRVKGEMAYIKAVSPVQYQNLVDYFFNRIQRRQATTGDIQYFSGDDILNTPAGVGAVMMRYIVRTIQNKRLTKWANFVPSVNVNEAEYQEFFGYYEQLRSANIPQLLAIYLGAQRIRKTVLNRIAYEIKSGKKRGKYDVRRPPEHAAGA
jgi:hypothetical protein